MPKCNKCGSEQAVKAGLIDRSIQRYRCKDCGHKYKDTQIVLKPKFEERCNSCIIDPTLKEGTNKLISLFHDLKMKPSWYHNYGYKCHYKGMRIVYISVHDNFLRIKVCTVNHISGSVYDDIKDMDAFFQMLPIEMKNEFINNLQCCKGCTTCAPGYDIEISGKFYKHVCEKSLYYAIDNPTPEQFEWIEKFIHARREYIANKI